MKNRNIIIICIFTIIVFIITFTYFKYDKQVKKIFMNDNSYTPIQNTSRETAEFNYPGANFTFTYLLPADKGSTVKEIETNKTYEISISGESIQKINIYLLPKDISDFFGEETNPNGFYYRVFTDSAELTHIRFYNGTNMADLILHLSNLNEYLGTIINSFKFNDNNALINQ